MDAYSSNWGWPVGIPTHHPREVIRNNVKSCIHLMQRSHLHWKSFRKTHLRQIFAKWVRTWLSHGSYGFSWQIWRQLGCYGVYVGFTGRLTRTDPVTATLIPWLPRTPRNCHEIAMFHSILRNSSCILTLKGRLYVKVWPRHLSAGSWLLQSYGVARRGACTHVLVMSLSREGEHACVDEHFEWRVLCHV